MAMRHLFAYSCLHTKGLEMKTINETRRRVIALAWEPYRMNRNAPDPRTFANALAGA